MEVPIRSDIQHSLGFPKCNGPKKTSYHHFVNTTYNHLKSTGNSNLHCSFTNLPYPLHMCNIVYLISVCALKATHPWIGNKLLPFPTTLPSSCP